MNSNILTKYQMARDFFTDMGLKEEYEKFLETSVKPIAFLEYAKIRKWLDANNISEEGYTFEMFFESLKAVVYIIEKEKIENIILISNFTLVETLKKSYISMCKLQFKNVFFPLFESYRMLLVESVCKGNKLLYAHSWTIEKISEI